MDDCPCRRRSDFLRQMGDQAAEKCREHEILAHAYRKEELRYHEQAREVEAEERKSRAKSEQAERRAA